MDKHLSSLLTLGLPLPYTRNVSLASVFSFMTLKTLSPNNIDVFLTLTRYQILQIF